MASVQRIGQPASWEIEADLLHRFFEEIPIFSFLDGFVFGADHLNAIFLKDPGFIKSDGDVEAGLAAQGGEKGIGSLRVDDLFQYLWGDRFDIGAIGHLRIGHDRGGVGVDQHHLEPFLLQGLTGLSAGVVKFAGLADDDGTGADDQDPFDVGSFRHKRSFR